jgi:hypothetical protein
VAGSAGRPSAAALIPASSRRSLPKRTGGIRNEQNADVEAGIWQGLGWCKENFLFFILSRQLVVK